MIQYLNLKQDWQEELHLLSWGKFTLFQCIDEEVINACVCETEEEVKQEKYQMGLTVLDKEYTIEVFSRDIQ